MKYLSMPVFYVLAAFVPPLLLMLLLPSWPVSDASMYFDSAISIARGEGYRYLKELTTYLPVGYPAFLGGLFRITGIHVWVGQIANILLTIASALLFRRMARHFGLSRRAQLITFVLVAFYPQHITIAQCLLTEPLTLFLVASVVTLLFEYRAHGRKFSLAISGLLLGASALIKPQLILGVLIIAWILFHRNGLRKTLFVCATLVAFTSVIILPWMARNQRVDGHFALSTNGGVNLLIGNNPYATGGYIDRFTELLSKGEDPGKLAVSYILAHPWEELKLVPKKLYYLYLTPRGTGMMWLKDSQLPASLSGDQFDRIRAATVDDRARNGLENAFVRNTSESRYSLRPDLNDIEKSAAANAILYSREWTIDLGWFRYLGIAVLMGWYFLIMIGGFVRLKKVGAIPIVMLAYNSALYVVFYGGFRYNYLAVPWLALPCALLLDETITKLISKTPTHACRP